MGASIRSESILDFGQIVNPSAKSFLVYIDVAEDAWFFEENDGTTRIQKLGKWHDQVAGILVGGSTDVSLERLDNAARQLHSVGVPRQRVGTFCWPELSPSTVGFASCPIVLNRCRYHPFEIYLRSIDILQSRGVPILPYAYLLVTPAENTSIGKVLDADVIDRQDFRAIERLASIATTLGLRTLVLEAGSGPSQPIDPKVVSSARASFDGFLLAGGGISNSSEIVDLIDAGASSANVGGALEMANSIDEVMEELVRSN